MKGVLEIYTDYQPPLAGLHISNQFHLRKYCTVVN
jgi:hypothetical protein